MHFSGYTEFDGARLLRSIPKIRENHLAIACGGTGGHVYPALALAEFFRENKIAITLLIAGHNSSRFIPEIKKRDLDYLKLKAIKSPADLKSCLSLPFSVLDCFIHNRRILKSHKINQLISMGGGPALSICLSLFNCPLYLHEANAVLGRSNRLLLALARKCFLSMPLRKKYIFARKFEVLGYPLRKEFFHQAKYSVKNNKKVLLVFGGSLGSKFINELVQKCLKEIIELDFYIIHLCGQQEFQQIKNESYEQRLYSENMAELYASCHAIISRAGAGSIFEILHCQKSCLFIPLKNSMDNHQEENLKSLGIPYYTEDELNPHILKQWLKSLL
jgi:UDP-N-acetylglucosamine--N-acetylmuramyl-(pentapeptide) pyrophosphoryl-undecaprenol N-acetylglucosamine transferase